MGIISRFKDIMESNINALLDKVEDPEKMIDQYLRNLEKDLASIKAETASVMAEEKAAKRRLDECDAEIARHEREMEVVKQYCLKNIDDPEMILLFSVYQGKEWLRRGHIC